MALELLGFRLLAPLFGASTYVWGSLLGVVMAALACGYLLGGGLADRSPQPIWVSRALAASALWLMLVLIAGSRLLEFCTALGPISGPLAAATVLLGPPQLLLGSISPFVVRLVSEPGGIGTMAGRVFALSTAGSLVGTFSTAFWLIPSYGSRATLRAWIIALALMSVAGLFSRRRASLLLLPLAVFAPALGGSRADTALFRGESAYNTVLVEESGGKRLLLLNDERFGVHSVQSRDRALTGLYYDAFYAAPILAGRSDILILGMAGGTTAQGYRRWFPGTNVTAVEIDPLVVQVADQYFGVTSSGGLHVRIGDARRFLMDETRQFDVIEADIFAGGVYAPFHVVTREFFELARNRLRPTGVIAVNVLALGGDDRIAGAVGATMRSVFSSVYEMPLRDQRVLFGFREALTIDIVKSRLDRGTPPDLQPVMRNISDRIRRLGDVDGGPVLTDDHAPIEGLTDQMLRAAR